MQPNGARIVGNAQIVGGGGCGGRGVWSDWQAERRLRRRGAIRRGAWQEWRLVLEVVNTFFQEK